MRTDDLDFHLPPELIAQEPAAQRSASRLLRYLRADRSISHGTFSDLPKLLVPGDLLVFNNVRVTPARFSLRKESGGRIDGLFIEEPAPGQWRVMLKNLGAGLSAQLHFSDDPNISVRVLKKFDDGQYLIAVAPTQSAEQLLDRLGRMPLPPYIRREREHDDRDAMDRARYQTVFAAQPGAIAAPTASLHFTPELLAELDAKGIQRTFVTLNVGLGTFKPISADNLSAHEMHTERYSIPATAADALNAAKRDGRRIIPIGTTAARVIESQPDSPFRTHEGQTNIFIYPPYQWKHASALVTNFHLPRSTLIALVAAMIGLDEQRRVYQTAIEQGYRFFSYGDAMLLE